MSPAPPRIRVVIDQVRVRGMSSRDARRLLDGLERELTLLAPAIAEAAGPLATDRRRDLARSNDIRAGRRAEQNAAPIANAIVKALGP